MLNFIGCTVIDIITSDVFAVITGFVVALLGFYARGNSQEIMTLVKKPFEIGLIKKCKLPAPKQGI